MENIKTFEEFDWKFGLGKKGEDASKDKQSQPVVEKPEPAPYVGEDDGMVRNIIKKIKADFDISYLKEEDGVYYDDDGSYKGLVYYIDGDRIYSDGYCVFIGDAGNTEYLDVSRGIAEELEYLLKDKRIESQESERNKRKQHYKVKYGSSNENRKYKR